MSELVKTYRFGNLDDLRVFLNSFSPIELSTIQPDDSDFIKMDWIKETLTDGSTVTNVRFHSEE